MSAFFSLKNLSSRVRIACFQKSASRNASKQVLLFRFVPSQFETHGASRHPNKDGRNRAPCPPYTDNPNITPEPSERQQKNKPHSQEPEPMHQQTENAGEDPRNRHTIRPRRADPRRNADRMQKPAGTIAPEAATRRAAPCIVASPNKYPQPEQTPHRTPYTEQERIAPTCHAGQKPTERPQNTLEAPQSHFYQFCEHLPIGR